MVQIENSCIVPMKLEVLQCEGQLKSKYVKLVCFALFTCAIIDNRYVQCKNFKFN